jgi:hypothetical protein
MIPIIYKNNAIILLLSKRSIAQRLAAQPLGRFRFVVTILAGNLQSHFSVLSLSLGQVGCSRGLGLPLRKTLNAINGSLLQPNYYSNIRCPLCLLYMFV